MVTQQLIEDLIQDVVMPKIASEVEAGKLFSEVKHRLPQALREFFTEDKLLVMKDWTTKEVSVVLDHEIKRIRKEYIIPFSTEERKD